MAELAGGALGAVDVDLPELVVLGINSDIRPSAMCLDISSIALDALEWLIHSERTG